MLSVVVPCKNEEENVARFERELFPSLESLGPWEVVAVDDGSTDGTRKAFEDLKGGAPRLVLASSAGRGIGAALRAGFSAASGDWIATLDADLTFDPKDIARLVAKQKETGADLVAGSPFLEAGAFGSSWRRRLPSLLVNAFYRGLVDRALTSYTPILRLYRASALRSLNLRCDGFPINAEIAAGFVGRGLRVAEVPCRLTTRTAGASKMRSWKALRDHAAFAARWILRRT